MELVKHLCKPDQMNMRPVIKIINGRAIPSWQKIPDDELTDDEFDRELRHEKWCQQQAHKSRTIHVSEAIEIFKDELYMICMDKINAGEEVETFKDLKFKLTNPMDTLDVPRAKSVLLQDLFERYGIKRRFKSWHCPFHDDSSPSMSIHEKFNRWKCWACGTGGDTIDFVMKMNNCDFVTAVKWLS